DRLNAGEHWYNALPGATKHVSGFEPGPRMWGKETLGHSLVWPRNLRESSGNPFAGVGEDPVTGARLRRGPELADGGPVAGFADGGAPSFGGMPYGGTQGY